MVNGSVTIYDHDSPDVWTVLPIDSLPRVPAGSMATHHPDTPEDERTWWTQRPWAKRISEPGAIHFSIRWQASWASRTWDEIVVECGQFACRTAAQQGYEGPLDLYAFPVVDAIYHWLAVPT